MAPEVVVMLVVKVTVVEGKGVEEDVRRRVIYYYDMTGLQLARVDEWEQEERQKVVHDERA